MKTYGREKILCDILRGVSNTDIQAISEAFKQYAKIMKVDKRLRSYLEVLI